MTNIRCYGNSAYLCTVFLKEIKGVNMSKIYSKYLELKNEDPNQLYLFRSGKFYIFIDEDADLINQYVVLKKTKFTNEVLKCGFPDDRFEDYMRVFKNHNLSISVVDNQTVSDQELPKNIEICVHKYRKIESCLKDLDIESTSPIEAIAILDQIVRCIRG